MDGQLIDIATKIKHGARPRKQRQLTIFACVAIPTPIKWNNDKGMAYIKQLKQQWQRGQRWQFAAEEERG